jgi:hypothetical protein
MKAHYYAFAPALLFALATSAHATTVTTFARNVKNDAVYAGEKVVQVGAKTGQVVWHAGKVVGSDIAHGMKAGYHATMHEVKKIS